LAVWVEAVVELQALVLVQAVLTKAVAAAALGLLHQAVRAVLVY
jgi:hypothetical protein